MPQDWVVTNDGQCHPCPIQDWMGHEHVTYRLYRFLTELEDLLLAEPNDLQRLVQIRPRVRRLLHESSWLQLQFVPPDPASGWSVVTLYDEPDFPLTVQLVAWAPGQVSPIHNHGTWGLVALLSGTERNTFWRYAEPGHSQRIAPTGQQILTPGDIITFEPAAIHQVAALGDEPTISFNLYGETDYGQRLEFDAIAATARPF